MKTMLLMAIFLASCGAIPEADAEEACREVFSELRAKQDACGGTSSGDPGCDRAYSYDDDELERCRTGLDSLACPELDTAHVTALCGKAFYLKTW